MKLDIHQLVQTIKQHEDTTRELLLRHDELSVFMRLGKDCPQEKWSAFFATSSALAKATHRATILYCIRAQHRNRLHMRKCTKAFTSYFRGPKTEITLEDQAKLIGDAWKEFERVEATPCLCSVG